MSSLLFALRSGKIIKMHIFSSHLHLILLFQTDWVLFASGDKIGNWSKKSRFFFSYP